VRTRKRLGRDEAVRVPPEIRAKARALVRHCGGNQSQAARELSARSGEFLSQRQFHRLLTRPKVAWKTVELVAHYGPEIMGESGRGAWLDLALSPTGARALARYQRAVEATVPSKGIVYAPGDKAFDPEIDPLQAPDPPGAREPSPPSSRRWIGTSSMAPVALLLDFDQALLKPVNEWLGQMMRREWDEDRVSLAINRIFQPLVWGEAPVGRGIELSLEELHAKRTRNRSALEEFIRLGLRREQILLNRETDEVRARNAYAGNVPPVPPSARRKRRPKAEVIADQRARRASKAAALARRKAAERRARKATTRAEQAGRGQWAREGLRLPLAPSGVRRRQLDKFDALPGDR
jgi:hypothetical protein